VFSTDEKSISDGTEVEGIAKHMRACLANLGRINFFLSTKLKIGGHIRVKFYIYVRVLTILDH